MSGLLAISGTDTDVGKTVVAAGLAAALGCHYWKPVQAGIAEGMDSLTAAALGVPRERIVPEAYRLALPASPHRAAAAEGIAIDPARLALSPVRPLIIEGAGGLMVPLSLSPPCTVLDQIERWGAPLLLVARTTLGTINHSLLSIGAARARGIAIAGMLFSGDDEPHAIAAIAALGGVPILGRIPPLDPLDATSLAAAIARHVDLAAIRHAMGLA